MPTPAEKLTSERLRFPGLLPKETIILREWLKQHETEFDEITGNVRLGKGVDPGPQYDESTRRAAVLNTQLKVDAVGRKGAAYTIIEVKDRADARALGQLLQYKVLWVADHPGDAEPVLVLLSNRVTSDLWLLAQHSGVQIALVEANFDELRS